MTPFFALFDEVRIISLAARLDRRREVEAEFAKIGETVDGAGARYFIAERPVDLRGFPSLGAHGCFMSHLAILRAAAASGARSLLILEDDVRFSKDFGARAEGLASSLADLSWDIFYGGGEIPDGAQLEGAGLGESTNAVFRANSDMLIMQTHCIGLSHNVIAKLVAYFEAMLARPPGDPAGGPMHVDGAYSWFRKSHPTAITFVAAPSVAGQRASKSDIYDAKLMDRLPFVRSAVRLARQIKNRLA